MADLSPQMLRLKPKPDPSDLWWTERHRDGIFSEFFYFSLSTLFHKCAILFHSTIIHDI
jgi:hypothetical protein